MKKLLVFLFAGLLFFSFNHTSAAPTIPTNVTAIPISACAVRLEWDQNAPGADYFTYQRSTNNFQNTLPFREPASGNLPNAPASGNFEVESVNLSPNTSYWYRIRACDNLNSCSSFAPAGSSVTTPSLPSSPAEPSITGLTADIPGGTNLEDVTLSWSVSMRPSQYGGFSIFRASGQGGFSYIGTLPAANPSQPLVYRDLGLSPAQEYRYQVYAYDTDYACSPADETSRTRINNRAVFSDASSPVTLPPNPENFSATLNSGNTPSVTLSWIDTATTETAFEIWKSTNSNFPSNATTQLTSPENSSSLVDSLVNPSTTYFYKVRACEGLSICSAFSPTESVVTGLDAPTLSASIVYTSNASKKGTAYLSWQGVLGATSYDLERSTSSVFNGAVSPTVLVRSLTFNDEPAHYDTNLDFGEVYYYRVRALGGSAVVISNIQGVDMRILITLKGVGWGAESGPHGIGWIKFNATSDQGSPSSLQEYSVQIDQSGLVTGAAWASVENNRGYGWLSFNPSDLGGCPASPTGGCEARFDFSSNRFSGWARFIAPKNFSIIDSWDGWVKLSGNAESGGLLQGEPLASIRNIISKTPFVAFEPIFKFAYAQNSQSYGITYDPSTRKLGGLAWSSVGWIAFGADICIDASAPCTVRADVLNAPPQTALVDVVLDPNMWCADDGKAGGTNDIAFRVDWGYSDPENDPQGFAEVRFTNIVDLTEEITLVSSGGSNSFRFADPLGWVETGQYNSAGYLKPDVTYSVAVRVNDGNSFSPWSVATSTFKTALYYYPLVDFSSSPTAPSTSSPVTFSDISIDRSAGSAPKSTWTRAWTFQNGNPSQSATVNPTTRFSQLPSDTSLTVSVGGGSCSYIKSVGGGGSNDPNDPNNRPPLKRRRFRET